MDILRRALDDVGRSRVTAYGPLVRATTNADLLCGALARALCERNSNLETAEACLTSAFVRWPLLCRAMAEIEAGTPELAASGLEQASRIIDAMDALPVVQGGK